MGTQLVSQSLPSNLWKLPDNFSKGNKAYITTSGGELFPLIGSDLAARWYFRKTPAAFSMISLFVPCQHSGSPFQNSTVTPCCNHLVGWERQKNALSSPSGPSVPSRVMFSLKLVARDVPASTRQPHPKRGLCPVTGKERASLSQMGRGRGFLSHLLNDNHGRNAVQELHDNPREFV